MAMKVENATDEQVRAHAARELEAIHRIVERLRSQFPERSAEQVERAVARAHAAFEHSPVRDFIPVLAERLARNDLQKPEPVIAEVPPRPRSMSHADEESGAP